MELYYHPVYFLPLNRQDSYDGTYILLIPLSIFFLTNIIGEYIVGTEKKGNIVKQNILIYLVVSMILISIFAIGSLYLKYNIAIMYAMFDKCLFIFYLVDRLSLVRDIYSVTHTRQIREIENGLLYKVIRYRQLFEVTASFIEVWLFWNFNLDNENILYYYSIMYILITSLLDGILQQVYKKRGRNDKGSQNKPNVPFLPAVIVFGCLKSIQELFIRNKNPFYCFLPVYYLLVNYFDVDLASEEFFIRKSFHKIIALTYCFLFYHFDMILRSEPILKHQYKMFMFIMFLSFRSSMRSINLTKFFFMSNDIINTTEKEYINSLEDLICDEDA